MVFGSQSREPQILPPPRDAKELAEAKARTYNLPVMFLDWRQDFAKQVLCRGGPARLPDRLSSSALTVLT